MATDDTVPPAQPPGDDESPNVYPDLAPPADTPQPPRRSSGWGRRLAVGAAILATLGLGYVGITKGYRSFSDSRARAAASEQFRAETNAQNEADALLLNGVEAAIPYIQNHPGQDFPDSILPDGVSKSEVKTTNAFKAAAALDAKVEACEAKPAKPTWVHHVYTKAERDSAAVVYKAAQDACAPIVAHKVQAGETLSDIANLYRVKVTDLDAHGCKATAIRAGRDVVDVKVYANCPPTDAAVAPAQTDAAPAPAPAVVVTPAVAEKPSLDQTVASCFAEKQFTDATAYVQDGGKAYDSSLATAKQVDAEVHVQAGKYAKHGLKDAELQTLVTSTQAEIDAVQGKRAELVAIQDHMKLCLGAEYVAYAPAQHLETQIAAYDAQVSHLNSDLGSFNAALEGDKQVRKELAGSIRQEYRTDEKATKQERKAAKHAEREAKHAVCSSDEAAGAATPGSAKYDSLRVDRSASVLDNILFSEGKIKPDKMVSLGEIASSTGVPADQTPVYNLRANNGVHFRYAGDDLNMQLYEVRFTQDGSIQLGNEVVFGAHEQQLDGKAKKANTFDSLADTGVRMGFNFDRKPGVKYHGPERADSIRTMTDAPNMYALVDPAAPAPGIVAYIAPMPHQRLPVMIGKYVLAAAAGSMLNGGGSGAGAVPSPPGPGTGNG